MKRLTIAGASMVSPMQGEEALRHALVRLGVKDVLDPAAVRQLYSKIGSIIGVWMANEEGKEASSVARALLKTGKDLSRASQVLSGNEDGFRTTVDLQVTSLAASFLTQDSAEDQDPQALVSRFAKDAARIAEACLSAHVDLSQTSGKDGRETLDWYCDLTAMLLEVAQRANVKPTLGNDVVNDVPCGWLYEAAQEFELFLDPHMRSPSPNACGKRLRRSLQRLRQL